ncbi:MAG: FAD-dependent oxidoreductase [Alphaproteobacteria bacterium]|nr:FAD-dependent oxidoreductase [Alphaproteobacteria bacterium]MBU0859756.1 FAD-dependent oxidoreductase [Alphaproteobacteria bacterium]
MKIGIIGTGIAGLGIAHLLHTAHDITIYEPNNYPGGHSRTIDIIDKDRAVPVDTGFIVFNHRNYPHLTALFKYLDVPTTPSRMSFGASISKGWLEYASTGMFAQKSNLLRPAFWGMVTDILRFNRTALAYIGDRTDMTLRECLDGMRMGDWFRRYYLQAMGAAIWSCPVETILEFPAHSFLRFFENHGLLTVNDHPQWHTVKGGSREYVARLTAPFKDRIRLQCGAQQVRREGNAVFIHDTRGDTEKYDAVIFACHADEARRLLQEPSADEERILSSFKYQENRVVVHTDTSFMPRRRACWSSWVYLSETHEDKSDCVSLSYWMNNLQAFETETPVIITLNPGRAPAAHLIHDEYVFDHPVFTREAVAAQSQIDSIQGVANIWYCGAYQRYGFHEDGLLSAVNVAAKLGITPPWL